MTLKFAVVYEAPADLEIATTLADRILLREFDWLDEESLQYQRIWLSGEVGGTSWTWIGIKKLALNAGVRVKGLFDEEPAESDARAGRRAIIYLQRSVSDLASIVLIRDQDNDPTRFNGLMQARKLHENDISIVIGFAVIEREAWVLSGFDPCDQKEKELLDKERQTLGFHPHLESHLLWACKNDQAKRSPKRVLRELTGGHSERERHCWLTTPLATLRERGTENGLTAYLDEVRSKLAPLIGHVPPNQ